MCNISCEPVGGLEPNLCGYIALGQDEDWVGFGDTALNFKVTAELNR